MFLARVPVKDRLKCSGVCVSWNKELSERSSCWRDLILGRNANCYDADPLLHAADWLPLPHVEEIKFTPAVPLVMKEDYQKFAYLDPGEPEENAADSMEYQITAIPLRRLRVIFNCGERIRKIENLR